MPKYQTTAQRAYRYDMIAKAEGEQCLVCYFERGKRPSRGKLIIEHADNNPKNWAWGNLHLCCYAHNKLLEQCPVEEKISRLKTYSDHLERERERENLPTWKTVLKDELSYDGASTEIQLSRKYRARWLRYAHHRIKEDGAVRKKELILAAAKYSGCSKQTSTNYLEVETANVEDAPFQETLDDDGEVVIVYRRLSPRPEPLAKPETIQRVQRCRHQYQQLESGRFICLNCPAVWHIEDYLDYSKQQLATLPPFIRRAVAERRSELHPAAEAST